MTASSDSDISGV